MCATHTCAAEWHLLSTQVSGQGLGCIHMHACCRGRQGVLVHANVVISLPLSTCKVLKGQPGYLVAFCQVQPLYWLLYTRCYWCRLWVMLPCPCRYARRCPQRAVLLHVLDVWSARLAACTPHSRRMSCVDVCVPSYRVQPDMLEGIIDTCLADM